MYVFQNCAGGGGRLDWGTLHRFHNSEISDWMRLPRTLKIFSGVAMSLPPAYLLRTYGTEVGDMPLDSDLDSQLRHAFLGRPILRGTAPGPETLTPWLRGRIEHTVGIFRRLIRPIMLSGRVYHHTPFLRIDRTTPWCVLEYASLDRARAVIGLFRTSDDAEEVFACRPRGIDPAMTYKVTFDNSGLVCHVSGWELMQRGIQVRLELVQTSELLLLEKGRLEQRKMVS